MARYFRQYRPSKFGATNVPEKYLPRQKKISRTIAVAMLCAPEIPGTFTGTLASQCEAEPALDILSSYCSLSAEALNRYANFH